MNSKIDCINIKKPNCEFYDSDRLCPDNCEGYKTLVIPIEIKEPIKVEEKTFFKKGK